MLIVLWINIVNSSNHKVCLPLSNRKSKIQPTFINLCPNVCNQEFYYYPAPIKLDRCIGCCNTLNDFSNKVCVPNKTKGSNMHVFNMITWKNE